MSSVPRPIRKCHSSVQLRSLHCDLWASVTLGFRGLCKEVQGAATLDGLAPSTSPQSVQSAHLPLSSPVGLSYALWLTLLPTDHWDLSTHFRAAVSTNPLQQPVHYSPAVTCLTGLIQGNLPTHSPPCCILQGDSFLLFSNTVLSGLCTCFSLEQLLYLTLPGSAEASVLPAEIADSSSSGVSPSCYCCSFPPAATTSPLRVGCLHCRDAFGWLSELPE